MRFVLSVKIVITRGVKLALLPLLSAGVLLSACSPVAPQYSASEANPGGALTHKRLSTRSYVYPGANISGQQQLDFWTGFSLFRDPWVVAPSSTTDRDGLGPLFITRSCISCHHAGGQGVAPTEGVSKPFSLVLRLLPEQHSFDGSNSDSVYGDQIQSRAINVRSAAAPLKPEAKLDLHYTQMSGRYPDGSAYTLWQPEYQLSDLNYGPLQPHMGISPRFSRGIYGAGLLDAISDTDLLAQEDPEDRNRDGISGHYNRVPNIATGEIALGRFGFKAKHPTLEQQVAAAFHGDIGITNPLFPKDSCTKSQTMCQQAALVGKQDTLDIPSSLLSLVVTFNRYLGVPPARTQNPLFAQGRTLFYRAQCHQCHTPHYKTSADYADPALRELSIWPYTDLALHDMGPELADNRSAFNASGQEWRTPPLWGLGLQTKIAGETRLLHDGRARSLEEAILWHGGEARVSQTLFTQFAKTERDALLAFLASI